MPVTVSTNPQALMSWRTLGMLISLANLSDDKNITDTKENQQNLCYIYKHIRLDKNEVFYIGKGTNIDGRYARAYSDNRTNTHWRNIVRKNDHNVEIIIDGLSEKEAFKMEQEYIAFYGRRDLGTGTLVNMTDGGEGSLGHIRSEETIRKTVISRMWYKHTDETRGKIGVANQGNKNCLGYKHTEETKKIMSDAKKGKKGKTHREDTKKLMSENGIKGKVCYYHKDTLKTKYFDKDDVVPDDYIKGITDEFRKILSDSGGKMWYYHKETFKNKRFTEGDIIPDCYIKGRYGMVNRNIFGIFCKACDVMMPPTKEMWYSYQEKQILRGEKASAIKREKYGTFNPIVKK